jgi:SPP1 gp7 family putative phage head morphogenesis protein
MKLKMNKTKRNRMIQNIARFTAAQERLFFVLINKTLNSAGAVAVVSCQSGEYEEAKDRYDLSIKKSLNTIASRIFIILSNSIDFYSKEMKNFYEIETKRIDFEKVYRKILKSWALNRAGKLIKQVSSSTIKYISKVIKNGIERGLGTNEISKEVKKRLTGKSVIIRSKMIARTETHAATQHSAFAIAKNSPIDMVKEWGATEDSRVRATHAAMNGKTIEIDDFFIVGGSNLKYPGDPNGEAREVINCRCVALYYPRGAKI